MSLIRFIDSGRGPTTKALLGLGREYHLHYSLYALLQFSNKYTGTPLAGKETAALLESTEVEHSLLRLPHERFDQLCECISVINNMREKYLWNPRFYGRSKFSSLWKSPSPLAPLGDHTEQSNPTWKKEMISIDSH